MNPSRQQEKALFERLVEMEDPVQRQTLLDEVGRENPALRRQLEELLTMQEPADALLSPLSATRDENLVAPGEASGEEQGQIGRYRLLRRLGAGGCGVVHLAEQQEPVRRQVALKVIRLGMDTENVIARFERERQALAIMDHPNIARVLDAGATDAGRPYFVMELVPGIKITDYCTRHRLSTEQRLRLFIQVCHAIQHAHQKGIIHRDIKPSNILVSEQDGVPVPKVIDFGIAKAIEGRADEPDGLTVHQLLIGTPAYMSPEQADPGNPDLDTRSDIYSLGVLLYELLTGRTPFDPKELEAGGWDSMRRILREREAPRPSTVLAALPPAELRALAEQRRCEPARLVGAVRGDLDWIVATTLEKDRRRRYETAYGLSLDIRRHLANELVSARPPSRFHRLSKLVRRNRVVFVAGALVLLSLLAGLGTSTWLLLREQEARREQARLLEQAEAGEKIARAAVLLNYDKFEDADALVAGIPDALFRPSLECVAVLRRLGEWHALAGRWPESARRHFALAQVLIRVDDSDSEAASFLLMPAASAILENGDRAQYDAFRRQAIARFERSRNPQPAEQVLKACVFAPLPPDLLAKLAPLADLVGATLQRSDPRNSDDPYLGAWRCFALALFELRRGDPERALDWCDRSLHYQNVNLPREISVDLVHAMASLQLGRREEAAQIVERSRTPVERAFRGQLTPWDGETRILWFDWINARLLLREAAAQLKASDSARNQPPRVSA